MRLVYSFIIILHALPINLLAQIPGTDKAKSRTIITEDIYNFWNAYDKIVQTKDSMRQLQILNELFISKGSEGLKSFMEVKRYTAQSYINAIEKYPKFWQSIRQNTFQATAVSKKLELGIAKLKKIYPNLKSATIYFTIGALRSGGTTQKDKVLIGSEIAFGNDKTDVSEIKDRFDYLPPYFKTNPAKEITFLNIHEYIHTQQKTTIGYNLLAQSVLEGVAEFITTIALRKESPNQSIIFGKENGERIKREYVKEMFSTNFDNWIWNSPDNRFGVRDLAYYMGYAICEKFYSHAKNKTLAIQQMIELDYNNEDSLITFVESTKFFEEPLLVYKDAFEKSRPNVIKIGPFNNGSQNVDTTVSQVTIYFNEPMDENYRNFDGGPLGDSNVMWMKGFKGFSEDGLSCTINIQPLRPNKRYQLLITDGFVNKKGIPLKPFLIDIKTVK